MTTTKQAPTRTFARPLPYGVSILRFDAVEGQALRIRVTRAAKGGWPEYKEVMSQAAALRIARAAERAMDEMSYPPEGWTDGGFGPDDES